MTPLITIDIDLKFYAARALAGDTRAGGDWLDIVFDGQQLRLRNIGPAAAATLRDAFAAIAGSPLPAPSPQPREVRQ